MPVEISVIETLPKRKNTGLQSMITQVHILLMNRHPDRSIHYVMEKKTKAISMPSSSELYLV